MIIDPHIHSVYSGDATGTPREIVKKARKIGLDAIAIADHNSLKGSQIALKEVKEFKDLIIIPSMELTTSKGHIVALGINEEIKKGLTPEETMEKIQEAGGVSIVPHPFVRYRDGLLARTSTLKMDAIETLNSRYIFGYSNWRAKKLAQEENIPEIGSSDAHFVGAIGSCVTKVQADFSIDSILEAIRKGKTTPQGGRTPLPLIIKEVINKKIKRVQEYQV